MSWEPVPNADGRGHQLWLRGPFEVVRQITSVVDYERLPDEALAGTDCTHALSSRDPFEPELAKLLDLLRSVISLPNPPAVHTAIALDWNKIPEDGVPADDWAHTPIGELVNRGKYSKRYAEQLAVASAGRRLTTLLSDAIRAHQLFSRADAVLNVPGHDSIRVSFGSSLADGVARELGVESVRVTASRPYRAEVKYIAPEKRREHLRDEFRITCDLQGRTVVIVDDMFQTGASMDAVAEAAQKAGARPIYGITAARTLKLRC